MPDRPGKPWPDQNHVLARDKGYATWELWCEAVEADRGLKICGALGKHNRSPCGRPAGTGTEHTGWGRCKHHGGSSRGGAEAPAYKGKGRSRYLAVLRGTSSAAFESFLDDPEQSSLAGEIALYRSTIEGLLAGWPDQVCTVDEFRAAVKATRTAIEEANAKKLAEAIQHLELILEPVALAFATSRQIDTKVDLLRKMVDTDTRRQKAEYEQVPLSQLHIWTRFMEQLMLEFVTDREDRIAIAGRIQAFTGGG